MSRDSTRRPRSRKAASRPEKPYPEFPLYPHALGYWSKKIRGKVHNFGRWGRVRNGKLEPIEGETWKAALEKYKAQVDDLQAGRTPRVTGDGLTVGDLCNRFLTAKDRKLKSGEITSRTFDEYKSTTDRLVSRFGMTRLVDDLAADDFETLRADIAKAWGPVRLGNEIQRVRTVFRYGIESGIIDKQVRFGPEFKKPGKSVMRRHRAKGGKRMFEAKELQAIVQGALVVGEEGPELARAGVQLRAMILLGVNCGFGNADCGSLPLSAVDLEGGWIKFPRPKTGIERRCPLWPETVQAIKEAVAVRPAPKKEADADLVFVTKYGKPWASGGTSDAVTLETGKLLRKFGIRRRGLGFYALRHTFRTVADATRDLPAVRMVMGHADGSIDDVYREDIDDGRLRAVTDHVRQWLFGDAPDGGKNDVPEEITPQEIAPTASIDPPQQDAGKSRPHLRLFAG